MQVAIQEVVQSVTDLTQQGLSVLKSQVYIMHSYLIGY